MVVSRETLTESIFSVNKCHSNANNSCPNTLQCTASLTHLCMDWALDGTTYKEIALKYVKVQKENAAEQKWNKNRNTQGQAVHV